MLSAKQLKEMKSEMMVAIDLHGWDHGTTDDNKEYKWVCIIEAKKYCELPRWAMYAMWQGSWLHIEDIGIPYGCQENMFTIYICRAA